MKCNICGSQLLELRDKEKTAVWFACPVCDKAELSSMRQVKVGADIEKVMGIKQ